MHELSQQKFCNTCRGKRRVWVLETLKRTFVKCPECEGVGFVTAKPEFINHFNEIEADDLQRQDEGQDERRKGQGEVLDQVADSFCRAIGSEIETGIAESTKDEIVPKKRGRPAKRK